MHKVSVTHKIVYTSWLRDNMKGWWRIKFNTDDPDIYFFDEKEDADKFEEHVKDMELP